MSAGTRTPNPFRIKDLEKVRENALRSPDVPWPTETILRLLDTIDWFEDKYDEACTRMSNARYELDWDWNPETGYGIPVLGDKDEG
jgi:hypothetical protein